MATALHTKIPTAHDRLKASFWPYVSAATVLSALIHFVVLSTARFDNLPDYSYGNGPGMEQVELLDQKTFEIPPPPQGISRPAIPILSTDINISSDITIGEVNFNEVPVLAAAPELPAFVAEESAQPAFTPYEIRPALLNGSELQKALVDRYPRMHREAGVGGTTVLWVYLDEAGSVQNTRIFTSSGFGDLDLLAESVVVEIARFSPAYNRDYRVPVWIQFPVEFEAPLNRRAG